MFTLLLVVLMFWKLNHLLFNSSKIEKLNDGHSLSHRDMDVDGIWNHGWHLLVFNQAICVFIFAAQSWNNFLFVSSSCINQLKFPNESAKKSKIESKGKNRIHDSVVPSSRRPPSFFFHRPPTLPLIRGWPNEICNSFHDAIRYKYEIIWRLCEN